MIQDGWIKVKVLSIVIEWSLVDNLVTSENKENCAEISKKKNPIILDILSNTWHFSKEMFDISWHYNLRVLHRKLDHAIGLT